MPLVSEFEAWLTLLAGHLGRAVETCRSGLSECIRIGPAGVEKEMTYV